MPTAILTFSLPEESEEHLCAVNAFKWKSVVCGLDNYLREQLKYGHSFKTPDEALEKTRQALFGVLEDEGLFIYD